MMLLRALVVLLAVSGCSESLFGTNGNPDGGSSSGSDSGDAAPVPDTCSAPCLADATANFDGTVDGTNDRWSYFDDNRDRTWTAMTPVAGAMIGAVNNRIERCADKPSATACTGLPGALLVTSSGTSSKADPALVYTSLDAHVIQLVLHVNIPSDSVAHRVRLYRNSREDVLFTTTTAPGATAANTITVDALAGDRFLVALEPTGSQGGTAAVTFFIIDANKTFPSACQLALTFADPTVGTTTVANLCGAGFTYLLDTQPTAPVLTPMGPYKEEANGLHFEHPYYLVGSQALDGGDRTVQFWVQNQAPTALSAWAFSDVDETTGRGLGIRFANPSMSNASIKLEAAVVNATSPVTYAFQGIDISSPLSWHFVRIIHAGGMVTFCLDGTQIKRAPLPTPAAPGRVPALGRNNLSSADDLSAEIDDVRIFSGTLPCNP
jgi:concanavalin A-like lectin/glucanase superfamily protein